METSLEVRVLELLVGRVEILDGLGKRLEDLVIVLKLISMLDIVSAAVENLHLINRLELVEVEAFRGFNDLICRQLTDIKY